MKVHYSVFMVNGTQCLSTAALSLSAIHTLMTASLPYTAPSFNHREQCGVQCHAQGHFNTWPDETRTEPANFQSEADRSTSALVHYRLDVLC